MSDCNEEPNQTDEETTLREVSDEALEAASVVTGGLPTVAHNTYCFACPSIIRSKITQERRGAADRGQHREGAGVVAEMPARRRRFQMVRLKRSSGGDI